MNKNLIALVALFGFIGANAMEKDAVVKDAVVEVKEAPVSEDVSVTPVTPVESLVTTVSKTATAVLETSTTPVKWTARNVASAFTYVADNTNVAAIVGATAVVAAAYAVYNYFNGTAEEDLDYEI